MALMPTRPTPVQDLNWAPSEARELSGHVVYIWEEMLTNLRGLPVARAESADEVAAKVTREIPREPLSSDELVDYLRNLALDWSMYPGHPGFMAYITGAGTVPGAAADFLAAAMNQNLGGWRLSPAATTIELDMMQKRRPPVLSGRRFWGHSYLRRRHGNVHRTQGSATREGRL